MSADLTTLREMWSLSYAYTVGRWVFQALQIDHSTAHSILFGWLTLGALPNWLDDNRVGLKKDTY
jgi:hypothetical protein